MNTALAGATSLREVIAFPKTAKAIDLMVDAPTEVSEQQLRTQPAGHRSELAKSQQPTRTLIHYLPKLHPYAIIQTCPAPQLQPPLTR